MDAGIFTDLESDGIIASKETVGALALVGDSLFSGTETHAGNVSYAVIEAAAAAVSALTVSGLGLQTLWASDAIYSTAITTGTLQVSDTTVLGGGATCTGNLFAPNTLNGASASLKELVANTSLTASALSIIDSASFRLLNGENTNINTVTSNGVVVDGSVSGATASFTFASSSGVSCTNGTIANLKINSSLVGANAKLGTMQVSSITMGGISTESMLRGVGAKAILTRLCPNSMTCGYLCVSGSGVVSTISCLGAVSTTGLSGENTTLTSICAGSITAAGLLVSGGALQLSKGATLSGAFSADNTLFGQITVANIFAASGTLTNLYTAAQTVGSLLATAITASSMSVSGSGLVASSGMSVGGTVQAQKGSFSGIYSSSGITAAGYVGTSGSTLAGLVVTGNALMLGTLNTPSLLVSGSALFSGLQTASSLFASQATMSALCVTGGGVKASSITAIGLVITGAALLADSAATLTGSLNVYSTCDLGTGTLFGPTYARDIIPSGSYNLGDSGTPLYSISAKFLDISGSIGRSVLSWSRYYAFFVSSGIETTILWDTPNTYGTTGSSLFTYSTSTGRWTNTSGVPQTTVASYKVGFVTQSTGLRRVALDLYNSSNTIIERVKVMNNRAVVDGSITMFSGLAVTVVPANCYLVVRAYQDSGTLLGTVINAAYPFFNGMSITTL